MPELWILGLTIVALAPVAWMVPRRFYKYQALSVFTSEVTPLFDEVVERISRDGQPLLIGRFGARKLEIEVIRVAPDVGSTYLAVTLADALALDGQFGAIVRPLGHERHTRSSAFPLRLKRPGALPVGVVVRASSPQAAPGFSKALPALAALLKDATVKEVLVTPDGARVLCHFSSEPVLRGSGFGRVARPRLILTTERLLPLVDGLADIIDAVRPQTAENRSAHSSARSRPR